MSSHGVDPKDVQHLLDAVVTVGSELSLPVVLRRIVEAATKLVDARYGALGVLDESGHRLSQFLTVGLDDDAIELIGRPPEGHGILGLLIVDPQPLRLPDLTQHPDSYGWPPNHPPMRSFLGVPIRVRGEVFGNLYLTDKEGDGLFTDIDEELCVGLAAAAGVAIENARLHARVGDLMVVEDRERIARDLHDTVIQRLFATGLALQGAAVRTSDLELAERLQVAVDDIDDTVRHIRTTIFELQRQRVPGRSVRQEVLDLVGEAAEMLGFDPVVRFDGPIDLVVPEQIADHLLAVAQESLSNVVKHSRATHVAVRLEVAGNVLTFEVVDDGVGTTEADPTTEADGTTDIDDTDDGTGRGLLNLRSRAETLGGTLVVEPGARGGTRVQWRVPLDQA